MAKNLSFTLDGAEYFAAPVKIERKKLYGWSEVIALDDEGNECSLVTVDETGSFIIPKPLKQDMRISSDKGQIEELYGDFLAANVKKGWEKVI